MPLHPPPPYKPTAKKSVQRSAAPPIYRPDRSLPAQPKAGPPAFRPGQIPIAQRSTSNWTQQQVSTMSPSRLSRPGIVPALPPRAAAAPAMRSVQRAAAPPAYRPNPPALPSNQALAVNRKTAFTPNPVQIPKGGVARMDLKHLPVQTAPTRIVQRALVPPASHPVQAMSCGGVPGVVQLKGGKKKKEKKEKNKKSKVKTRENFEPDYLPSPTTVDTNFLLYSSNTIDDTEIDEKGFLNFTLTHGGKEYKGHINIKGGYALAHVTIAFNSRLINYYYLVTAAGTIEDPPKRYVSGGVTEKFISNLPSEIKDSIVNMLETIYA